MLDDDTLLARALAALASPLCRAELAAALDLAPHGQEADAVIDALLTGRRLVDVGDGRIASAPALLDGLVLWHRLDPVEAGTRRLALGVDGLLALDLAPDPDEVLVGEASVPVGCEADLTAIDIDRGASVTLPDDWAPDLQAGDLVALVVDGDRARVRLASEIPTRSTDPSDDDIVGAFATALTSVAAVAGSPLTHLRARDRTPDDQWVLDLAETGPLLLVDHGGALRDLDRLPLREAVARAGLRASNGVVGGPGVTPRQLETYLVGRIVFPDAPPERSSEVEACGIAYGALAGPETEEYDERATARALDELLRSPGVADAVVRHLRLVNPIVVGVAEHRVRQVRRRSPLAPGPAWVHASLLLRQARAHDARRALEGVVSVVGVDRSDEWELALQCAAHVRMVAGDLGGAIEVLRRVGADVLADRLVAWDPPRPDVGRNDRCPCGSGTKAKRCCLASPLSLPLARRTELLWDKVTGWALSQDPRCFASTMALGRLTAAYGLDPFTGLDAALDAVLLEGGGVGSVLDEVGGLLPTDEQDLAMRWRHGRHRLWHVSPTDGRAPVWRDVVSGERAVIAGRLDQVREPSGLPTVGGHVVAALLPGPVGHHLVGAPVPVGSDDVVEVRDRIALGPDALELVTMVAGLRRRAAAGDDPGGSVGLGLDA